MNGRAPAPSVVAVVLAAGRGRRFGSDKRRARLADGQTLLQRACAPALAAGLPLYLALRPEDPPELLPAGGPVQRVDVARADQGMGVSLATAVAALPAAVQGCLVLLGDMPGLQAETLCRLRQALAAGGDKALVAPVWQGRRGHPVGLGRYWFAELQELAGDSGARHLLQREGHRLQRLVVADPGVIRDVDRRSDLD